MVSPARSSPLLRDDVDQLAVAQGRTAAGVMRDAIATFAVSPSATGLPSNRNQLAKAQVLGPRACWVRSCARRDRPAHRGIGGCAFVSAAKGGLNVVIGQQEAWAASDPFVAQIDQLEYVAVNRARVLLRRLDRRTVRLGSSGGVPDCPQCVVAADAAARAGLRRGQRVRPRSGRFDDQARSCVNVRRSRGGDGP